MDSVTSYPAWAASDGGSGLLCSGPLLRQQVSPARNPFCAKLSPSTVYVHCERSGPFRPGIGLNIAQKPLFPMKRLT